MVVIHSILFFLGLGILRVAALAPEMRLYASLPANFGHITSNTFGTCLRKKIAEVNMVPSSSPRLPLEGRSAGKGKKGKAGMVFLYSPSSLRHLNYFDKFALRPVFNSTLTVEEIEDGKINGVVESRPSDFSSGVSFFSRLSSLIAGDSHAEELSKAGEVHIVDEAEAAKFAIDRPARLRAILDALESSGATVLAAPDHQERNTSRALNLLRRAHTQRYIDELRAKAACIEEDKIRPLSLRSTRTYIDRRSFDAAVDAVSDWIDAVDHVLGTQGGCDDDEVKGGPAFALVRPPSHHACPSRGMGGCLLNSCAIAANYALEAYHDKVKRVAILDVDAHHGNGVAACVEERRGVKYCSIHEEAEDRHHTRRGEALIDDPRGPAEWDVGPLSSLRNVPLPAGTGWDGGYRDALVRVALPFLLESKPDVLLVACGFDALAEDQTSGLQLKPEDYAKLGRELKTHFGNRVVFGLEGGYCWENGQTLGDAVVQLASAWGE